jgi:hypothetical protein
VQQGENNSVDCGVFTMKHAEHLLEGKPFSFDATNMPEFRKEIREKLGGALDWMFGKQPPRKQKQLDQQFWDQFGEKKKWKLFGKRTPSLEERLREAEQNAWLMEQDRLLRERLRAMLNESKLTLQSMQHTN